VDRVTKVERPTTTEATALCVAFLLAVVGDSYNFLYVALLKSSRFIFHPRPRGFEFPGINRIAQEISRKL